MKRKVCIGFVRYTKVGKGAVSHWFCDFFLVKRVAVVIDVDASLIFRTT